MASDRVLIIVGGFTEYRAFRRWVAQSMLRKCEGICALYSLDVLVRKIRPLVLGAQGTFDRVIIVIDRETRQEDRDKIEREIEAKLRQDIDIVCTVVCADRMVENWMLADVDSWSSKKYLKPIKQKYFDGVDGLATIKSYFIGNWDYDKARHGVEFLNAIRPGVAKKNSRSFGRFAQQIGM